MEAELGVLPLLVSCCFILVTPRIDLGDPGGWDCSNQVRWMQWWYPKLVTPGNASRRTLHPSCSSCLPGDIPVAHHPYIPHSSDTRAAAILQLFPQCPLLFEAAAGWFCAPEIQSQCSSQGSGGNFPCPSSFSDSPETCTASHGPRLDSLSDSMPTHCLSLDSGPLREFCEAFPAFSVTTCESSGSFARCCLVAQNSEVSIISKIPAKVNTVI